MVEMEVHRVQVSSRAYHRVVLHAKEGEANLHIVIGPTEARAISMAHRGQKPSRPLSYDMAHALLDEAGARIEQVAIIDLQDGIYYAEIRLLDEDGRKRVVDSRPSDAIALALRSDAPIFADESVLEDEEEDWDEELELATDLSGPSVDEELELATDLSGPSVDEEPPAGAVTLDELLAESEHPVTEREELEKRLQQAVAEEAYEEAARLRDRLSQMAKD
ncbi:MAG TPA: bifunctional nuclease family protein [Candidatus Latescibacteria bacterium]|mgnify:FL=1|jgi:bifunctional DNase/RNase|nr:bifunctional nuclease family protein [Candidatus Latescibacterota bacterium]